MGHAVLKGRPPFPFETIGVLALSQSPRMEEVIAEAAYLAKVHDARLLLICIGNPTGRIAAAIDRLRLQFGLDLNRIHVVDAGKESVGIILEICRDNVVDLLVLETIRRERALRYYLGSTARGISRAAKCSLLLLTEPRNHGTDYAKIIVSGVVHPKTVHTLKTVVYLAEHVGAGEITLVMEIDQPALAMTAAYRSEDDTTSVLQRQVASEEEKIIHDIAAGCRSDTIAIAEEIIFGRQGYAIRQYADKRNADLLAINSPDAKYGLIDRIFTHDMEYILENMPCNVLIVHSRIF